MNNINIDTLLIIQCRYSSSRLRGKALLEFGSTNILSFLIRRLKHLITPNKRWEMVLATSIRSEDNLIKKIGHSEKIKVVRGELNNVLSRYVKCLNLWKNANTIIRVTADNPLTCPDIIDKSVKKFKRMNADYCLTKNFPIGLGVDIFSKRAIDNIWNKVKKSYDKEHINNYILSNRKSFKIIELSALGNQNRPDLNFSIDVLNDYCKVFNVIQTHPNDPLEINTNEAIERMDRYIIQRKKTK